MAVDYKRPSKDDYYLGLAVKISERSTCLRRHFGALIVKDDALVSSGYNGAPRGARDCLEDNSCLRKEMNIPSGERYELCKSVHAEQNAIINAARSGTSLMGGDMYIYGRIRDEEGGPGEVIDAFPCFICKKMLINCGLKKVICSLKDGGFQVFEVENWMKEWSENDIIDDKFQYGVKTAK